ncbi:MAG: hypothetical protein ACI8Y7_000375 [Candidatus Woesearchaeota archaeon]|jgi:hypothetical protein
MRKKIRSLIWIFIALFAGLFYGVLIGQFHIWPYDTLAFTYKKILPDSKGAVLATDKLTNPDDLLRIDSESDVLALRTVLKELLFDNYPNEDPQVIIESVNDNRYIGMDITALHTIMKHDIQSIAYYFKSETPNGELIIFHQGHRGDFVKSKDTIKTFLDEGYDVIAFSMPLLGMNSKPLVNTTNGFITLNSHNDLAYLNEGTQVISYFVEPIIRALEYTEGKYTATHMVGISGGG